MSRKRKPSIAPAESEAEATPPRARSWRPVAVAIAGILLLVVAWAGWRALADREAEADGVQGEFVGTGSCAGCHQEEHAAWKGSQHDLAMQEATPATVLGDFADATFEYAGVESRFFRRGDEFLVRTDGSDGKVHDFRIRYTFGVFPLQQYLIELEGGRLQPLTIAWDSRPKEKGGQRWFHLYPGERIEHTDELHWTGIQQNWNFMCADCHSTNLQKRYDPEANAFRTTWSEINVGCEACHGPGSRHVEWARDGGEGGDNGLAAALDERRGVRWAIDPRTGSARRSEPRTTDREIETCAQCHARRAQIAEEYAAGEPYHDYYHTSVLMPGLYWPDGQQRDEVYTYGSFRQSRMYHQGVTCSDCHDPHSQKIRAPGNQLCGQCHSAAKYEAETHSFHPKGSEGAQCSGCHMPTTTYMVVDPRHDHSFRVPRPDLSVKMGVPNACSQCHADRGAAWAAERVREWLGRDARGFQRFAEVFHASEQGAGANVDGLAAIATDLSHPAIVRASALARVAERTTPAAVAAASASLSDRDPLVRRAALSVLEGVPPAERMATAVPLLEDSVRIVRLEAAWLLAPVATSLSEEEARTFRRVADEFVASQLYNADRPENRTTLGTFYAQLGRTAEAEAQYLAAIRMAPRYVPAYVNLSDLYRGQGREADAERTLRQALRVAPTDPTLHHSLGLTLVRAGRIPEATAELERAASLAPDNPRMVYVYGVALHSAGHVSEAIRALRDGLSRNPGDRDLLFGLAAFSRDAGDLAGALEYAQLLVGSHPQDAEARQLLQSLAAGMR